MKHYHIRPFCLLSQKIVAALLMTVSLASVLASEAVEVMSEEIQIHSGGHHDVSFTAPADYASGEPVLVVTAWVASPKFRGYCAVARFRLNDIGLESSINRGPEFSLSDGRKEVSHLAGRWTLPYTPAPEEINQSSPYYVEDIGPRITRLILLALGVKAGENTLRISHDNPVVEEPLVIRSITLMTAEDANAQDQ